MILKLMNDLCKQAKLDMKHNNLANNSKFNKKNTKVINLDYADNMCQKIFSYRQDEKLQSRIKFKIQDVIDSYNKEWRFIITETKNKMADTEGFKKIYIPKD